MKLNINGSLKHFKIKLIAKRFIQKYKMDFFDIFAFIMQSTIIRSFLFLITFQNSKVYYFDIKNVFIEIKLKKKIFLFVLKDINVKSKYIFEILQSFYKLK